MKRTTSIIIGVVIALVLAGSAFWGGMSVGKAQARSEQNSFLAGRGFDPNSQAAGGTGGTGGTGAGGFGGRGAAGAAGAAGGRGARGATGTIQKIEGNTITLQDNQGATTTVTLGDNTPVLKTVLGNTSDLAVGQRIVVQGTRSGSNVAATGIQLNDLPAGVQGIFGGGRATPTPTLTK